MGIEYSGDLDGKGSRRQLLSIFKFDQLDGWFELEYDRESFGSGDREHMDRCVSATMIPKWGKLLSHFLFCSPQSRAVSPYHSEISVDDTPQLHFLNIILVHPIFIGASVDGTC